MYTSWKHLIIRNETELRDPKRINKLIRASGRVNYLTVTAFAIAGIVSLSFSLYCLFQGYLHPEFRIPFLIAGGVLLLLVVAFYYAVKMFLKEISLNHLRNFMKTPDEFEFVTGELDSADFIPNENRRQGRYQVMGKVAAKNGHPLLAIEYFSRNIWNFTTKEAEDSLQEGDDWYDLKGKRPLLPVPAYFIYNKMDPKVATLVGIDAQYVAKL